MSGQSKSIHALAACFLAAAACSTPGETEHQATPVGPGLGQGVQEAPADLDPPAPRLWTDAFEQRSMLLANTIAIEGPVGLLDHVVVRADDALYERSAKTTSEGFLQTVRAREQGNLVRGQLDGWQLAAFGMLTILERPGMNTVRVTASGEAVMRDPLGAEQRDDRLEFTGPIEAEDPE